MTEECLDQARQIKGRIEQAKYVQQKLKPYFRERTELTITAHKQGDTFDFVLFSDSPLTLAIFGALQDLIDELQRQFDTLGYDTKETADPIKKTSWWAKVWRR